jgi:hypothetical protein
MQHQVGPRAQQGRLRVWMIVGLAVTREGAPRPQARRSEREALEVLGFLSVSLITVTKNDIHKD